MAGPAEPAPSAPSSNGDHLLLPAHLDEAFERSQKDWLNQFQAIEPPTHIADTTPWLDRTGFLVHLRDQDRTAIRRANAMPGHNVWPVYGLPNEGEEDRMQEEGDSMRESSLQGIVAACARLLDRGGDMARQAGDKAVLSHLDARILQSFESTRVSSMPFRPVRVAGSRKKYAQIWQRFLCYVLRLTNPADDSLPAGLIQVTVLQGERLQRCREVVELEDADNNPCELEDQLPWLSPLEDAVLQASLAFIEHDLPDSPFESALLSYLATRALKDDGSWMAPSHYTSILSGLVHNVQLLLFLATRRETDLRQRASGFLTEGRFRKALKHRCQHWLTNDSASPVGTVMGWRLYARKIAADTLPPAWTGWDLTGETVTHREVVMTMTGWRELLANQIKKATNLLEGPLLFDAGDNPQRPRPRVRDMQDVPSQTRPSYSFVDERRNGLQPHARWLYHRVFDVDAVRERFIHQVEGSNRITWRSRAIAAYLREVESFLEHLLLLMHLTAGLPARAPELLSIRHCNDGSRRNVMIHDGRIMILTGYHKMQYATGSRLVARFLPEPVGDLLLSYLAMVLPLV